jgi:hypothetical protein
MKAIVSFKPYLGAEVFQRLTYRFEAYDAHAKFVVFHFPSVSFANTQ